MFLFDLKALNNPSLHSQPNSIKRQRVKSSLDKQGIKLLKFWFPTQSLSLRSCLFKANLRFRRLLSKIFWCSTSSRPTSCLWWWGNHMRRAVIRKIKLQPRTNLASLSPRTKLQPGPNQPKAQRQNYKTAKIVPTPTTHESIQSEYSFWAGHVYQERY